MDGGPYRMTNLLQQAINCDDADRAAKLIQDALGRRLICCAA
jgi:hypothetical protein